LINGPVGLLAIALIAMVLRDEPVDTAERPPFDFVGFALVATFLGSREIVLDRGLIDDWFGSSFIVASAIVCGVAFMLMIPWEISRRNPMVDIGMLASRQLGACFLIMGSFGVVLYATTQFLPQLVQENYGYTATWAGLVLSPGGLVTMAMMFIVGRVSGKVQAKYLIAAGGAIIALSMYDLTRINPDLGFWYFADSRMLLGLGLPLIIVPIITASYVGIPPQKLDQASALINVARNTGGSIGVSLASNVLAHREQFHQARLSENIIPSSIQFQQTMQQATQYFVDQGSSLVAAQKQAFAWIGQTVQVQASYFAYVEVFWVLTLVALAMVPLALGLRNAVVGGPAPVGH
jgi:DHA2 family multidrug resistance protein